MICDTKVESNAVIVFISRMTSVVIGGEFTNYKILCAIVSNHHTLEVTGEDTTVITILIVFRQLCSTGCNKIINWYGCILIRTKNRLCNNETLGNYYLLDSYTPWLRYILFDEL